MRGVLIRIACGVLPFVEEPPQGSELGGSNVSQADRVVLGLGDDDLQCLRFSLEEVRIEAKVDVVDL